MAGQKDQFLDLIPAMREWSNFEGYETPPHWLQGTGSFEQAIAYSFIFWPEFVVVDDHVLRADAYEPDNFETWRAGHDRTAVEGVLNHVHILDLFPACGSASETQLRSLGRTLARMLEAKLALEFPDREFHVLFNDEPCLDPIDYQVTFWQADGQPKPEWQK